MVKYSIFINALGRNLSKSKFIDIIFLYKEKYVIKRVEKNKSKLIMLVLPEVSITPYNKTQKIKEYKLSKVCFLIKVSMYRFLITTCSVVFFNDIIS